MHKVSGSISSPFRGTFNLSLTVLVHYRSSVLFSLGGWSPQIQSGFLVSEPTQEHSTKHNLFRIQGYHLLWPVFPNYFAIKNVQILKSYNPCTKYRFGLVPFRSPLLRESHLIYFPQLLRCFSSLCILQLPYFFKQW